MALRNIVVEGDPILKKVCRPVTNFDSRLADLLDDMKETLIKADGLGLAGPQVGMLRRLCIAETVSAHIELLHVLDQIYSIRFQSVRGSWAHVHCHSPADKICNSFGMVFVFMAHKASLELAQRKTG